MATSVNQKDWVSTALRLPPELRDELRKAGEASGRSFNAEIVARLQASFQLTAADLPFQAKRAEIRDMVDELLQEKAKLYGELIARQSSLLPDEPLELERGIAPVPAPKKSPKPRAKGSRK